MGKAISTIIASVLILLMVIGLAGTAFIFISGVFTGSIATAFEIIDAVSDTVIIRNSGQEPITYFRTVKIDGDDAVYRVSKQDNSLAGYWKMDESSWTKDCTTKSAVDSSGKGNDGKSCPSTSGPTTEVTTDKFGNAGKFDKVDDSLTIDASISIQNIFDGGGTVMAWIKPISVGEGNEGAVLTKVKWLLLLTDQSGSDMKIRFYQIFTPTFIVPWTTTSRIVKTNEWTHVAVTYDNGNIANDPVIYANGKRVDIVDASPSGTRTSDTGNVLTIGNNNDGTKTFDGHIDEVMMYDRILTEQEIKAAYDTGAQINPNEPATMKVYKALTKGTHTLRLCTPSMCNTGYLSIN